MKKEIKEQLIIKYIRIIHQQDLGKKTEILEYILRDLIYESIQQERERIIEEIEKMKIEIEPQAEGTDVDDTMRTINNTLSDVINKIKNIK